MAKQEEDESPTGSPGPSKRRRYSRVSRACNECRLRKVRCDGRQPCGPCQDFGRRCTFTSTKGQRVAGAPRTKILEDRLRRARSLFSKIQAQNPSSHLDHEVSQIFDSPPGSPGSSSSASDTPGLTADVAGEHFENMLDGRGRLTSTKNSTEFYGGSSGFAFLQQTQQLFNQGSPSPLKPARHLDADAMSRLFDSPLPDKQALATDVPFSSLLPSRKTARELLQVVFGQTYQLLQFIHEPTFQQQTDRIYEVDCMAFNDHDHDFLPLFYAVTALGYLFHRSTHEKYGCSGAVNQAMRHFIAARRMVNLDRCRDIHSLQTLVCFILFLMSTARLASAHTYIGLAVAASMRLGLHSQASCEGLSEFEKDTRRRVFWTIVKLDIYSGTVLGLPGMMNLDYADQRKPSGNTRDYANADQGGFSSIATQRMFAASAQYLDVLLIIGKVTQRLYPKTDAEAHSVNGSRKILVSNATITEIENDFRKWREGLSEAIGTFEQTSPITSIVYELEMVHNFGHILLYRPFLHYLARTRNESPPDERLLRCATSCIKISRFTIIRSDEMLKQGFLAPAAWQSVYTVFLSLVTLVFFLATQHGNKEYTAIQTDTETGIRILASTACQDIGSRKCLDVLRVLSRRLSHIIDLDVDKVSQGVVSLCRSSSPMPPGEAEKPNVAPDARMPMPTRDGRGVAANQRTVPIPSAPHQFEYPPDGAHHHMGPTIVPPVSMPMYHATPPSAWEQFLGFPGTPHHPYLDRSGVPYFHAPTQDGAEAAGQSEMEVPYTEGFAWPFEVSGDPVGDRAGRGRRSAAPPANHPLTQEDIAAFMRINPGDEPFL